MNQILTHRLFRDDIADGILELVEKQPGITTRVSFFGLSFSKLQS